MDKMGTFSNPADQYRTFDVYVRQGNDIVVYTAIIDGFGEMTPEKSQILQDFTRASLQSFSNEFSSRAQADQMAATKFRRLDETGIHFATSENDPTDNTVNYSLLENLPSYVPSQDQFLSQSLANTYATMRSFVQGTAQSVRDFATTYFNQTHRDYVWDAMVSSLSAISAPSQWNLPYVTGTYIRPESPQATNLQEVTGPQENTPELYAQLDGEFDRLMSGYPWGPDAFEDRNAQDFQLRQLEERYQKLLDAFPPNTLQHQLIVNKCNALIAAVAHLHSGAISFQDPLNAIFAYITFTIPKEDQPRVLAAFQTYIYSHESDRAVAFGALREVLKNYDASISKIILDAGMLYISEANPKSNSLLFTVRDSLAQALKPYGIYLDPYSAVAPRRCPLGKLWALDIADQISQYIAVTDFVKIADKFVAFYNEVETNPANRQQALQNILQVIDDNIQDQGVRDFLRSQVKVLVAGPLPVPTRQMEMTYQQAQERVALLREARREMIEDINQLTGQLSLMQGSTTSKETGETKAVIQQQINALFQELNENEREMLFIQDQILRLRPTRQTPPPPPPSQIPHTEGPIIVLKPRQVNYRQEDIEAFDSFVQRYQQFINAKGKKQAVPQDLIREGERLQQVFQGSPTKQLALKIAMERLQNPTFLINMDPPKAGDAGSFIDVLIELEAESETERQVLFKYKELALRPFDPQTQNQFQEFVRQNNAILQKHSDLKTVIDQHSLITKWETAMRIDDAADFKDLIKEKAELHRQLKSRFRIEIDSYLPVSHLENKPKQDLLMLISEIYRADASDNKKESKKLIRDIENLAPEFMDQTERQPLQKKSYLLARLKIQENSSDPLEQIVINYLKTSSQ